MKCCYVIPYVTASQALKATIAHLLGSPDNSVVVIKDQPRPKASDKAQPTPQPVIEPPAPSHARNGQLHLIADGTHKGYTRAVNFGIAYGLETFAPELFCILNDDVLFMGEATPDHRHLPEDAGLVGVLSNRAGYQSLQHSFDEAGDFLYPESEPPAAVAQYGSLVGRLGEKYLPVPLVHGFCFYVRPDVLAAVGGLDEAGFPGGYGSDFDLSLRVQNAGYRNLVWSGTLVWHYGSRSFGAGQRRIRTIGADFVLKQRYGAAYVDAQFKTRNRMIAHTGNLIQFARD